MCRKSKFQSNWKKILILLSFCTIFLIYMKKSNIITFWQKYNYLSFQILFKNQRHVRFVFLSIFTEYVQKVVIFHASLRSPCFYLLSTINSWVLYSIQPLKILIKMLEFPHNLLIFNVIWLNVQCVLWVNSLKFLIIQKANKLEKDLDMARASNMNSIPSATIEDQVEKLPVPPPKDSKRTDSVNSGTYTDTSMVSDLYRRYQAKKLICFATILFLLRFFFL